jgi:hypothetical protein
MVSPKLTAEIMRCYEALREQRLDIHRYSGPLLDVVFEMITADTFVAGVARKLMDGDLVAPKERIVVRDPLLLEDRWWRCDAGQLFDLEPYEEIRMVATSIESLRAKCKDALSATNSSQGPVA